MSAKGRRCQFSGATDIQLFCSLTIRHHALQLRQARQDQDRDQEDLGGRRGFSYSQHLRQGRQQAHRDISRRQSVDLHLRQAQSPEDPHGRQLHQQLRLRSAGQPHFVDATQRSSHRHRLRRRQQGHKHSRDLQRQRTLQLCLPLRQDSRKN